MQTHRNRFITTVALLAVAALFGASASAQPAKSSAPAKQAAPATQAAPVDETQANEAALRAIAVHWGDAELGGDVGYLEQLLTPEYRSVDAKGVSHPRAMILAHARRSGGAEEARKARDAFMKAHPTEMSVTIHGTVGVVSYFDPRRGLDASIRGGDVFVYEAKRWHAVFSLHNGAG
ncbi:MAG: nuclear transport factor 2 family protein [Kofleriaceae bacterium]